MTGLIHDRNDEQKAAIAVSENAREQAGRLEEAAHIWEWNDDMSVGVASIDADHRDLAERYNGLVRALFRDGGDPALFETCFRGLIHKVHLHFTYEQRLMIDLDYPAHDSHAAEHEKLLGEAEELTQRVTTGVEKYDCCVLVRYVKYWLIEHIAHEDRRLARFLHACRSRRDPC